MPTMMAATEVFPNPSTTNDNVKRTPAAAVVRDVLSTSASLPARLAAATPPTPTSPNRPITRLE
jgi:hypothetical protein